MIFDEELWGTTIPKAMCKGSTDPDCQMKQERTMMIDFLVRLCFSLYYTSMLYRYARQKEPKSEETIALTAVNHD